MRRCDAPSFAFTLSETLIALVIIGIIAAVTVPAVVANAQKRDFVERLKKTYSTFSNATKMIMLENGSPKGDWAGSLNTVYNLYKPHLTIAKDCGSGVGCWGQYGTSGSTGPQYLNKNGYYTANINTNTLFRKLILSDGVQVAFFGAFPDCSGTWARSSEGCSYIVVDLNGERKPNQFGRDTFIFVLKEDGLHPNCSASENYFAGYTLACKVLREGEMNY